MILLSIAIFVLGVVWAAFSEDLPVKALGSILAGGGAGLLLGHFVVFACHGIP